MKQHLAAVLLAFLLASCATTVVYTTDYPLTSELFHSRDGMFSGNVPQGWFSSTADSLAPTVVVWLIKNDFSAVLSVKELKLDRRTEEQVIKEGYTLLARLSMGLQDETPVRGEALEPKEFEMRGKKYCSYEISSAGVWKRIVVFSLRGKFYECECRTIKGNWSPDAVAHMFSAQQTVIVSFSF